MIGFAHSSIGSSVLAPVLARGESHTPSSFERERHETERGHVEPRGLDLARQVRVAGVAPLLARLHHGDLAGHDVPEAAARRVMTRSVPGSRQRAAAP